MDEQIIIRPVQPEDFHAWRALWDGYNAFYGREGDTALPEENTRVTWSRFFDGYEPMHALVAEADGRIVGLVHYLFHRSTIEIGAPCYLQDLFTVEAVRGQGVGRALIQAVYDKARDAGSPRVYWRTRENNHVAMRLYDQVAERISYVGYLKML